MASLRPATRYSSSTSSSSDPSPSSKITSKRYNPIQVERNDCRALMKAPSFQINAVDKTKTGSRLGTMVRKLMEKRSAGPKSTRSGGGFMVPVDPISEDFKRVAGGKGSSWISGAQRKLLQRGSSGGDRTPEKALTEVKSNTRTLAMVLRSERELMNQNKQYEEEISEMQLLLEEKNREIEKLKDLCLKQREEIKALKDAILFPDVMNSQLQQILKCQGSELNQAKQVIPKLQKQVTDLTGQLQCLAEGLAEISAEQEETVSYSTIQGKVKADKHSARKCSDGFISSPKTPILFGEASNSLEYSSGDPLTLAPDSPDDMFLNDYNPCLTPRFAKTKFSEFDEDLDYDSAREASSFRHLTECSPQLSKSSECFQRPISGSSAQNIHNSEENKWSVNVYQKLF